MHAEALLLMADTTLVCA